MMTRSKFAALAVVTVFSTAAPTFAQSTAPPPSGSATTPSGSATTQPVKGELSRGDTRFLEHVARDSQAEIELGRLAAERGGSDAVKQFGDRMVKDHSQAANELKQLAQQKGITLSEQADRKHSRAVDRLSKLSGAEFDRAFVKDMVKDHEKAVSSFRREAQRAKDADVKQWASKTLPTLEDHLKSAQSLQATVAAKS
jgi:putative membrane protein